MKPCLTCGTPSPGTRCSSCQPADAGTTAQRGYDNQWRRLSERARRLSPFCEDCGTTLDLTTDHTPEAWRRRARGLRIRLIDVAVVCRGCNTRRGKARPTTTDLGRVPASGTTTTYRQPREQLRMDLNR